MLPLLQKFRLWQRNLFAALPIWDFEIVPRFDFRNGTQMFVKVWAPQTVSPSFEMDWRCDHLNPVNKSTSIVFICFVLTSTRQPYVLAHPIIVIVGWSWARFDTESKQGKENHGQMRQRVKGQLWPWPSEPLGFWISVSLRRDVCMCRNNLCYWLWCPFSVRSCLESVFDKRNIEYIQFI